MANTFTYDLSTLIGQLRLNISDINLSQTDGNRDEWTTLFSNEELQVFLTRAADDMNLASYYALMVVASSKSMLAKRRTLGDYSEDLTQLAVQIRAQAKAYYDDYAATVLGAPACDYAEQSVSDFAINDILNNQAARGL